MKLQTRLLTAAAALMLAAVAQAAPPPGFTTNSQATLVTNAVLWSLWGPGLTADGALAAGGNSTAELDAMHFGHADLDFGLRTADFFTNNLQGPYNGGTHSYWAGAGDPTTTSYADQFIGVFIPPVTTNYVFFICSDDFSELYLGTDIGAASAQLIAQETVWSNPFQWTASAGASSLAQKRSDQFSVAGGPQYPNGTPLVAGNMYYIELDHENGNGGYNDEVYYKFAGAPDPLSTGSVQTDMTNTPTSTILSFVAQPPTFVNLSISPTNATVTAGHEAAFNLSISSDGTVGTNNDPYSALITWQTNGITVTNADGTIASGHTFGLPVGADDTGVKVTAQVTLVGETNVYTSGQATITVNPATPQIGGLRRDFWFGDSGGLGDILSFNVGLPNYSAITTNGQGLTGTGINDYDERYSGWFTPPTTGSYVFFVSSDDQSDLFISTDDTPDNKYLIAQETVYGTNNEWSTDSGGTVPSGVPVSQKRSDQFIPSNAAQPPYAAGIALTAGKQYYIEADHWQGGGGDDFGMTYSLVADANSVTDGVPTAFGPANLAYAATLGTSLTITTNPVSTSTFQGDNATFSVAISANGDLQPVYHWLVNGVDEGTGTIAPNNLSSVYGLASASLSLNNATIQVVVDIPFTSLAATSTVATLTVNRAVVVPGFLEHQFWANQGSLPAGIVTTFGPASYTNEWVAMQAPVVNDGIDNYTQIASGYFIPPETGNYVFNLCSDDTSHLFLSTDDSGANAKLIAEETAWSTTEQWGGPNGTSAGSSSLTDKESDTFTGADTNGIALTAGSNYFIAAVHEQGGGGDNLGVYFWTKDGNYPAPADGTPSDLTGTNIAFVTPATTVTLLASPQSTTVLAGNSTTLSVTATSTSTISTPGTTNTFVSYQWYTNGVAVVSATKSSYVTPLLGTNDSGETVYCVVGAVAAPTTNSATATLTVTPDPIPGGVLSAFAVLDSGGAGGEPTNQYVDIIFSKSMDLSSVTNPANYTIAGATIVSATVFTNSTGGDFGATMAILQLAAPLKGPFTVSMPNVLDFSLHNVTNSTVTGTFDPLTSVDINQAVAMDVNGTTYYLGNDQYEVDASGIDIWGANDSFRYVYTTRTNNFDVVVQVPYIAPADQWTKAGLMVRELIDPIDGGSRMMSIEATASKTLSPAPLDGSTAQNFYSMGVRDTQDIAAYAPPVTPVAPNPSYYIGDGLIPVPFPNVWLRLTRTQEGTTNDQFTGYYSTDGQDWTAFCAFNPEDSGAMTNFPSVVYVGMCTTAHIAATAVPNTYLGTVIYQNFGDFVAGPPPSKGPTVTAAISGGNINISWAPTGGSLYSSPTLSTNSANWTLVGTANPYSAPLGNGSLFFKVIVP